MREGGQVGGESGVSVSWGPSCTVFLALCESLD